MAETIPIYSPAFPLGAGSFAVDSDEKPNRMLDLFKAQTTDSFLIYGQRYWEFVPVPVASNPIARLAGQLLMLYYQYSRGNTNFDHKEGSDAPVASEPQAAKEGTDFFCKERSNAQVLYEGRTVRILYPDNPVVDKHFLIVTKAHRESLKDLSHEEFEEVVNLAKIVGNAFEGQRHILMKNSIDAGLTVPHVHFHLMIAEGPQAIFWGQVRVASNILLGWIPCLSSRLRGDALTGKVTEFSPQVKNAVNRPLDS